MKFSGIFFGVAQVALHNIRMGQPFPFSPSETQVYKMQIPFRIIWTVRSGCRYYRTKGLGSFWEHVTFVDFNSTVLKPEKINHTTFAIYAGLVRFRYWKLKKNVVSVFLFSCGSWWRFHKM